MKRSELLLVGAVAACALLALIALMARRYSAAAAMTATMKVEQHNIGVATTDWVSVDGVRHAFAASGPTNFVVSGRALSFSFDKVTGTNGLEVSKFSQGRLVRRELSPRHVEGHVICPSPRMAGLTFWKPTPQVSERMYWYR